AEQHHRVRNLSARTRSGGLLHESILSAVALLRDRGVTSRQMLGVLAGLQVHPVFTAHPSEARRRSLLHHLEKLAGLIGRLHTDVQRGGREALLEQIRVLITLLWQTAETRTEH